jgi:sarcosine oxidase subunit delta
MKRGAPFSSNARTRADFISSAGTFLFERSNPRGLHFERWYHVHGCGRYFNAVRDTVSDRILLTYPTGQPRPTMAEIEKLKS